MKKKVDYLIIGGGPAGIQLGYYLQHNQRDYVILERGKVAGYFFKRFPRHRLLISINKVFTGVEHPSINLRWDWNSLLSDYPDMIFKNYDKAYFPNPSNLLKYLSDFVKKFKIKLRTECKVKKIMREGEKFIVQLQGGDVYEAKRVIVATGVSKPFLPAIKGIEHAIPYTEMSLNKKLYENKRILILGKGNSGFETADHLTDVASLIHVSSPNPVKFAWRSHFPGNLRAINCRLLDTYQLKSQNALINSEIDEIRKVGDKYQVTFRYTLANDEVEMIEYDCVLACTGFKIDESIFDKSCMPELVINNRFPKQTPWYESTNIPNLFIAGTLMQMRDFKKKQSSFIHGFRYNIRFLSEYMEMRYENHALPHIMLADNPKILVNKIIERVNETSALWQQTGYSCDAIVYDAKKKKYIYYRGIPTDMITEGGFAKDAHCFAVTLEFGQHIIDKVMNTFAIERVHKDDTMHAHLSTGIHPIVRHYHKGKMLSEHHLIEDFESVWAEDVHRIPLENYLKKEMAKIAKAGQKAVAVK